ncbi:MAG: hypothetical protein ACI9LN_002672 [Saprospiraceae bacterium]|jgi:hypothetical protein
MKKSILFLFYILLCCNIFAQDKNDYIWVFGYPPNVPDQFFGGSMIDFHTEPPEVSYFETLIHFQTHTALSDEEGNLLLYSNGCRIANGIHNILENGDSINAGAIYDDYCEIGYPSFQSIVSLPLPDNDSLVYLFHTRKDDVMFWINRNFLYTIVNINENDGNGRVTEKNQSILDGDFYEGLTAVRHGNGRDWWLILTDVYSNRINLFLFDPTGVHFSHSQEIGEVLEFIGGAGQATFSPDGTKYIRANNNNNIHIYDFDRCSGWFASPVAIEIPVDSFDLAAVGAVVSSNSQYLYVPAITKIHQYNLNANNIAASHITVAEYDGYASPPSSSVPLPTTFFQGMLAPNEKIYITANNGVDVLHIIHEPNQAGLACNVEQHGLQMPTRHSFQVPNFPHFRLYDMQGSPCDTLGINDPVATEEVEKEERSLLVYPNPAQTEVKVSFPYLFTGKLTIVDVTGKTMLKEYNLIGSNSTNLSVDELSNGIYILIAFEEGTNQTFQQKLVIKQ